MISSLDWKWGIPPTVIPAVSVSPNPTPTNPPRDEKSTLVSSAVSLILSLRFAPIQAKLIF